MLKSFKNQLADSSEFQCQACTSTKYTEAASERRFSTANILNSANIANIMPRYNFGKDLDKRSFATFSTFVNLRI